MYEDIFKPHSFEEYVGQEKAKSLINIMLDAADREERYYPNIMLSGPPGTGKTSLANIIYQGLSHKFVDGNAANSIYSELPSFVIIDEIHNMKARVCDAINLKIDTDRIHIIGCTTNPGMLPGAFRSRFQMITLEQYSLGDMIEIINRVVERKEILEFPEELVTMLALRSRQTPRTALKYLSFVMDVMIAKKQKVLDEETLGEAFEMLGVDEHGLLEVDRMYLEAFPETGQPVGLQYLSAVLGRDKETIEEEIEPYLLQLKLIDRTSRGRKLVLTNEQTQDIIEAMFEGVG